MILLKLKWQQINIIYYNNESHNVYDDDIENKRKMLSLIIKKVWYIPLKKIKNKKNNSERKQIETVKSPHILSFHFGGQWVNSLVGLGDSSI